MSKLKVYGLGGAGINVSADWKRNTRNMLVKEAEFIGLDTSDANVPEDGIMQVDPMEGGRGSGKSRTRNLPAIPPYVEQMMSRHKAGDFNIVVFASSSSGGQLGPYVVRNLIKQGKPVAVMLITDDSSLIEIQNTAKTIGSLDGQRRTLDTPVVIDRINNSEDKTRREINAIATARLDNLALFLTDAHTEADYEDVKNLLNYSNVDGIDIPASLVSVKFITGGDLNALTGKPVAIMSLYADSGDVRKIPGDFVYRATGVFNPSLPRPSNVEEMHMVLEYDSFIRDALRLSEELEERVIESKSIFKANENLAGELNDDGMVE